MIYSKHFSFFLILLFSFYIHIHAQQTANVDILSVSTVPTCASIFSSAEDQSQLCGPNGGDQEVADVLLNINIGEVQPGAASLTFNAFPFPGTTSTTANPTYPCGSTPNGQNCSTFASPITVTWNTKPTVGAYQMKKIVSGIPLSYLLYQSALVVDVDDQEMDWRRAPQHYESNNADACTCSLYNLNSSTVGNPSENEKICSKCVFTANGAFIRGLNRQECLNSQNTMDYPACGQNQVDLFCSCGGFAQECAQTSESCVNYEGSAITCGNLWPNNPNLNNLGNSPCMCFPYNQADIDNSGRINEFNSINLKQGGMHQTNAHNYIDDLCSNAQPLLLNDNSVLNFNNHALAACRKMAYFIGNQQGIPYSQIEPFVKLNGICSQYLTTTGCGNQPSFISRVNDKPVDVDNCPIDQECYIAGFFHAEMPDYQKCLNQIIFAEDNSCSRLYNVNNPNYYFDNGSPCRNGIIDRFGANAPLGSKYTSNDPSIGDVCLACRADYLSSGYLPGLYGNQRKCKLWIDDWQECFVGAYENAYFDYSNSDKTVESSQGFSYYNIKIPGSPTGATQQFVLQPQWCMEMLGKCNPAASGDTCWSSYNQPTSFFNNPYFPSQGNINTQGFEFTSAINGPSSGRSLSWTQLRRGLALTPFWTTPVSDSGPSFGNGGHMWRCGHACDPEYANSYTFTTNNIFPTQDPKAIGSVKGMTGVGPLCTAYEVSLQGQLVSEVELNFNYIDANGNTFNQKMTLGTSNIGTGSNFNTLDLNGTGVYGRITNDNSPSTQSLPLLGGVLMVCGVDEDVQGPGSLNGNLDVTNQGFSSSNPWQNLIWLLQKVELLYPGVTGYFQGGCPVPIPTFVTALQCFSASTVCSAPPDLCQAIFNTCDELNNNINLQDDCNNHNIVPYNIQPTPGTSINNPSSWQAIQPVTKNVDANCDTDASQNSMGAAWYWLPPNDRAAFGKNFGQFGVNPWTDFTDDATGQSICSTSHTVGQGVPGVPGVTSNTNVDPSCSIIGNLARFHGQSSQYSKYFPSITQGYANNLNSICLSDTQQTLLSNNATINLDASCDANYFSTFSAAASQPTVGLPPNWVPSNPQQWVHQNFFMTSEVGSLDITLEVQLLISGYGLNVEVVNVENGNFVADNSQCTLLQNSAAGQANLTIVNTGLQTAEYQITLDSCIDASGDNVAVGQPFQIVSVEGGKYANVQFNSITLAATPGTKSLLCNFDMKPVVNPNILLSTIKVNCVVLGFLQISPVGMVGIDGKLIPTPPTATNNLCSGTSGDNTTPAFICWMIYGGWLSHSFFIIFMILLSICAIAILVYSVQSFRYIQAWLDNSRRYNITMQQLQEQASIQQEKNIVNALNVVKNEK